MPQHVPDQPVPVKLTEGVLERRRPTAADGCGDFRWVDGYGLVRLAAGAVVEPVEHVQLALLLGCQVPSVAEIHSVTVPSPADRGAVPPARPARGISGAWPGCGGPARIQ